MTEYSTLFEELTSTVQEGSLFDNLEIAEPVVEKLPPPIVKNVPSTILNFVNRPKESYQPDISDDELNVMVEHEVDFLMTQIDMFLGLGKGGFSELIISEKDLEMLRRSQAGEEFLKGEIEDILERQKIKESFETTQPTNRNAKRQLMVKIVRNDMMKQRRNGTLELPTMNDYMKRMLVSEFAEISGKNYKVFTSIGKNFISKFKNFT